MSSMAIEGRDAAGDAATPGGLKALFFIPTSAEYRVLEGVVAELLAAGHRVLVVFNQWSNDLPAEDRGRLNQLREQQPGFDHARLRPRTGMWGILASAVGRTLDYTRYLEPEYADAEPLRERARDHAPRAARLLLFLPPFRWAVGRRAFAWALRRVEAGIPLPRDVKSLVSQRQPDVVLVSSQVEFASAQADYIRTASAARVPWLFVVTDEEDAALVNGLPQERVLAVAPQRTGGADAGVPGVTVEAIERAARGEASPVRTGLLMRPVLWLLSPVLALLLVILRPRASFRAAIKGMRRLPRRIRRRTRTRSRRDAEHSKALAVAARQEKLARAETARQTKTERARLKAERGSKRGKPAPDRATDPAERSNGGDDASREAPESREKPLA